LTDISDVFSNLKAKNEGALIAYITAGDPHPKNTPLLVEALIDGGADIVELGIPFSDPIADGPTIQRAMTRSLESGCRPIDVLEIAETIHERHDIPLIIMTSYNPVFRIGLPKFLRVARKAGISGMIIPDLALEESDDYKKECTASNMETIFLATPSTGPDRLKRILNVTSGFLYLVSLYGVTGARTTMAKSTLTMIQRYSHEVADSIPLAVGFGISKPVHVNQIMNAGADGVIVGSAFVNIIENNGRNLSRTTKQLKNLAKTLKRATHTRD